MCCRPSTFRNGLSVRIRFEMAKRGGSRSTRNRQDLWMGEFYGLLAVSSTS